VLAEIDTASAPRLLVLTKIDKLEEVVARLHAAL
jgi:50S ribosomal subunit-associated GTPase HflX